MGQDETHLRRSAAIIGDEGFIVSDKLGLVPVYYSVPWKHITEELKNLTGDTLHGRVTYAILKRFCRDSYMQPYSHDANEIASSLSKARETVSRDTFRSGASRTC